MGAIGINPDFDLEDLVRLATSDEFSVQYNPLIQGPAGTQGGTILKSAPAHKGMTKSDGESMSDYIDRLNDATDGVGDALQAAQDFISGVSSERGLAVYKAGPSDYSIMPHYSAKLGEQAGNGEVVSTHETVRDAINGLSQAGGQRPARPAIF